MRDWIVFFSQTGSEIANLLIDGYKPSLIVTNKKLEKIKDLPAFKIFQEYGIKVISDFDNSIEEWNNILQSYRDCLVTLHGYLKIVPADICNKYTIYNGHPGDIVDHPELKGKDPQKKALDLNLEFSGCVIHKVTSDLDGGPIEERSLLYIKGLTEEELTKNLKRLSLFLWKVFLNKELK